MEWSGTFTQKLKSIKYNQNLKEKKLPSLSYWTFLSRKSDQKQSLHLNLGYCIPRIALSDYYVIIQYLYSNVNIDEAIRLFRGDYNHNKNKLRGVVFLSSLAW